MEIGKITKCVGEGQGKCARCDVKGKWNRHWTFMLNKIEGFDGNYCSECTQEILKELEKR